LDWSTSSLNRMNLMHLATKLGRCPQIFFLLRCCVHTEEGAVACPSGWRIVDGAKNAFFSFQCLSIFRAVISQVDFTNVLRAAFRSADSECAKRNWWLYCLFSLLGSVPTKAAHKNVGEIEPCRLSQRRSL